MRQKKEYGELVLVPPDHLNPTMTAFTPQSTQPASPPPDGLMRAVFVVELLNTTPFAGFKFSARSAERHPSKNMENREAGVGRLTRQRTLESYWRELKQQPSIRPFGNNPPKNHPYLPDQADLRA